jgi:glycosyltransferase involved in cell wall biosynthesis
MTIREARCASVEEEGAVIESAGRKPDLKVAISFPFAPDGGGGGTESVSLALLRALDDLDDGDERYIVACLPEYEARLKRVLRRSVEIVVRSRRPGTPRESWRRRVVAPARQLLLRLLSGAGHSHAWPEAPLSDGFFESLGVDVVHFPEQGYELCALPTVYNPHDLQHRHFPQFFSARTIAAREVVYRTGCSLARVVPVASEWIRDDLIREYGVHPSRIAVIPWAAPTEIWERPTPAHLVEVRERLSLPGRFVLYPAMTWPHKNHVRLLEALAVAHGGGAGCVSLVCTGAKTPHFATIEGTARELGLLQSVFFTGMLSPADLVAVYAMATMVIVPSLYEAASGPLFEAWWAERPAAVARVTSLPQQAGDAAVMFDPFDTVDIARAITALMTDNELREKMVEAGRRRLAEFSWERVARSYRAVYRRAAGRQLSADDLALLGAAEAQ